jgi:hypothetical protein
VPENGIETFVAGAFWNLDSQTTKLPKAHLPFLMGLVAFMRNIECSEFNLMNK